MVAAHQDGLRRAPELFAAEIDFAMARYPGNAEAQFSYLAGLFQELRRLSARAQNKGFRKEVS